MRAIWQLDLPTNESSEDYHFESSIFIKNNHIYFLCYHFTNEKRQLSLNIIDKNSGTTEKIIPINGRTTIPSQCFFQEYKSKIIIYTGELWIFDGMTLERLSVDTIDDKINSYFIFDNCLIFADASSLYSIDLDFCKLKWKIHIPNTKNYIVGDISLFENSIACYGKDQLLFVDISSGQLLNQIKIPRVDKLFQPMRMDDGTLLIGFTNWSNAGIIRYDETNKKIIWKGSRSFEGPLLRRKIYLKDNRVYWVKNDTELICLNANTGDEIYRAKTSPWLYTDLLFTGNQVLYGTAGRDGFLVNLDSICGNEKWAFPLKNGCAFFDFYKNSAIVGDFNKKIYQIDIATGKVLQEINVDGEVVGQIKVCNNDIYTVIWGDTNRPVRLIKLNI
ncbi:MAG: hypothetical protein E7641_06585 [Ruminococcaceae bacterium]|nr:hypothetical protein [Oscillospiraceae bacterium]